MVCRLFFFFKQKTAYEMRISDWSSDVCSSDLVGHQLGCRAQAELVADGVRAAMRDAAIDDPADVHFVQIKCPLLTAQRIDAADARVIGRTSCRERVWQYG